VSDDSFYIIFNADANAIEYKLPSEKFGRQWTKIWDTADMEACTGDAGKEARAGGKGKGRKRINYNPGDTIKAEGRSVLILASSRS
jgi:glycogen operon protein